MLESVYVCRMCAYFSSLSSVFRDENAFSLSFKDKEMELQRDEAEDVKSRYSFCSFPISKYEIG